MKQYVLDELRLEDYDTIRDYFDKAHPNPSIDGLYCIELKFDILSDIQKEHVGCAPFYFAINLRKDRLCCELLVHSTNQIRCNCISYANLKQRNWIIQIIDTIVERLKIIT